MRVGIFDLVNPPVGQGEVIEQAIDLIDFPWDLLRPALASDPDGCVRVEWGDTGQGVSGLFYGSTYTIRLSTRSYHLGPEQAFVFAHEVGHLVDRAILDGATKAALIALMHVGPFVQLGHFDHDHADAGHSMETWANGSDSYVSRVYECFADLFVAAYAPTIWDGTTLGSGRRFPRFVHWTDDVESVRALVTPPPPPPAPKEPVMARFPAPSPAYLGPAKYNGGDGNKPIDRVVIHGTTGTNACRRGFARIIARYFRVTDRAASAHYAVDPFEVVQIVFDSLIAYHAPPNAHSLAVELCDAVVGPLSRWDDRNHKRMLRLAARLVAELCLAYDVPVRWVGPVRLRLGVKGITSHANVGKAWRLTDHWDPGKWPRREFMRLVRAEVDEIRAEADHLGATRITKFRDEAEALIAKYLDPAVERGRKGRVEQVRDNLRAELARLPRR